MLPISNETSSQAFEHKGRTPKKIHFSSFCEYYADMSAGIEDDEYFER